VNKPTKKTKSGFIMAKLFTDSFPAFDLSKDISDATSEVPEWPQEIEGWTERPLDLNMLWEVLEKHKKVMQERDKAVGNIGNTWELVVVQTVILVILALIALMWGFCCRKQCFANNNDTVSVSEALRKLSKDLPPSYSMRDLHTLGISVDDHLHPPPAYLELFKDDLQYLDLEAGHSRMAKLSFCSNGDQGPPRLARLSVASCATCSNESPVVVPVERTESRPSLSWSRRSSTTSGSVPGSSSASGSIPSSGRTSRVSFSEEVICSNGSVRRLSSNSRKSSSTSSEGSRKSSLASKIQEVKRKLGSQSSASSESFMSQLDEELQSKLKNLGKAEVEMKVETVEKSEAVEDKLLLSPTAFATPSPLPTSSSALSPAAQGEVSAESQGERAARVCDIIHEQREK
jgi:hypothetical protein